MIVEVSFIYRVLVLHPDVMILLCARIVQVLTCGSKDYVCMDKCVFVVERLSVPLLTIMCVFAGGNNEVQLKSCVVTLRTYVL